MTFLRSPHPESVYVALVNAGSGATLPRIIGYPIVALQAWLAAVSVGSSAMVAAAAFAALCSIPRAATIALWNHHRRTIADRNTARRWELLNIATGIPFSLAVGLIAAASVLHGGTAWMAAECTIALGYASSFTVSIGFRPKVAMAFIVAVIAPVVLACLLVADTPHLTLAVMAVLLVLVLHSNIVAVSEAVVTRTVLQQEAHKTARLDSLTSLPNRRAFDEHVAEIARKGEFVALVLCDLDGFKEVNDTLGHKAGDILLAETAVRLRQLLVEGETAFRLGGDEFGILCKPERAEHIAESSVAACKIPAFYKGVALHVSASAGIAIGLDESLQQAADAALYAAKREGRACWRRAPPLKLVASN